MKRMMGILLLAGVVGAGAGFLAGSLGGRPPPEASSFLEVGDPEPIPGQAQAVETISEAEAGVPNYPGQTMEAFGQQVRSQGAPMRTGWFETSDSIEDVQAFYERRFAQTGLPVFTKRFPSGLAYVSYQERDTKLMHTVVMMPTERHGTRVFVSASSPGTMLKNFTSAKVPQVLPHPADAEGTMVMEGSFGPAFQRWITARVPKHSLEEVTRFYRTGLQAKGWQNISVHGVEKGKWIEARRGSDRVEVTLNANPQDAYGGISVFVLLVENHRSPEEAAPAAASEG